LVSFDGAEVRVVDFGGAATAEEFCTTLIVDVTHLNWWMYETPTSLTKTKIYRTILKREPWGNV
jgi:hypothetical protein